MTENELIRYIASEIKELEPVFHKHQKENFSDVLSYLALEAYTRVFCSSFGSRDWTMRFLEILSKAYDENDELRSLILIAFVEEVELQPEMRKHLRTFPKNLKLAIRKEIQLRS